MRQPDFAYAKTKAQVSAFVFSIGIVQFLLYLHIKFQDSSFILRLYRSAFVRPGRKFQRPVFSRRGSVIMLLNFQAPRPAVHFYSD